MMQTRKQYIVGIDPGVKTGLAVFDSDAGLLVRVNTTNFWGASDFMELSVHEPDNTIIVIENPNFNRPVWRERGAQDRPGVRESMAQRVGANKRDATLLIERFESKGFEVQQVKPTRRKWTAAEFQTITGWRERTSQHARDAAALIYRR